LTEHKTQSFERATPVLRSTNYPRSRAYYCDTLGFVVKEEGGDPAEFGILDQGSAIIFIDAWHGGPTPRDQGWDVYFHVSDVHALYKTYRQKEAIILTEVQETEYGMLEFEIRDPDGNILCFGQKANQT